MKYTVQTCFLVTSLLFNAFLSFGQTTIKGEVLDAATNDPLIGASIFIQETGEGTVSDFDGSFELKIKGNLPVKAVVSYTGFAEKEITISAASSKLTIKLEESAITVADVEVVGQRISDKQKASPLTVESLDLIGIKATPAENFYDGLGSLKGVDLTSASLGFKVINMRGFNSTSPVRSLQLIDGVDNQAPGLNFSLGNFLGSSELDVLGVDLIQGASSAFYGPNAFNGVINITTKSPFLHKGLSVQLKGGERKLASGAIRWADAFKNKNGHEFIAYKLNLQAFRADDWVADNYNPVDGSRVGKDNPGRFDAVNIYGDEFFPSYSFRPSFLDPTSGLEDFYRTGYKEEDIVDYDTRNGKASVAVHIRTNPSKDVESPELIIASSYGTGTTVYQGDNRFSLRNIRFYQNRLELRKEGKFFIRLFATQDNAGDSYDPYFTALKLQEAAKSNGDWGNDYVFYWKKFVTNNNFARWKAAGYPNPMLAFDPSTGTFSLKNQADLEAWYLSNQDSIRAWHIEAENWANMASDQTNETSYDFYDPDKNPERFKEEFDRITSAKSNSTEGGTKFYDKSALYNAQGEYKFQTDIIDNLTVGANARLYTPRSEGTIFYDTAGIKITNFEFGSYVGGDKKFWDDRLTLSATVRVDKNENFNWISTPAASIVFKPRANNFLRLSFSSAIRNPTLSDQYLFLKVGRATLAGNLNGVENLATVDSYVDYTNNFLDKSKLVYFNIDPIQPEKVKTFELGYRTTLFNSVYVDAGYYYNIYNDFIGYKIGLDIEFQDSSSIPKDISVYRYAANSNERITSQGFSVALSYYFAKYFQLSGNYSWNRLNTQSDDEIVPAFNTPEHKFNIGISGRDIPIILGKFKLRKLGFNINYRWVDGFLFEGSPQFTGFIPSYDLLDAQVNLKIDRWDTTFKIGATNLLENIHYETYGGPSIGRLAYISIQYEWNKR
ncbi:MAG: carboxypeptidase-like regulatory domain-containing protein [Lewinellaceae bacterium]|nr:carboxypeptidase-like regulatory domain-containing protein [Saprospiraceae bacterium]MCB9341180.1 carboxypeptidase-like regulatory domain-containing protein [Lewinellaceae bacterium]